MILELKKIKYVKKYVDMFWLVKAVVFPVVVYGCENCTVKRLGAE